jgi:catechol 2,3-dioxygenase-like lactoylglutathione lyase family enzyme
VNTDALPAPGFHHLHLNSVDPDAAIGFYTRQFLTTRKITWGGQPALASPNDVLILFSRVATAPPTSPQTAIWHFGWHVTDSRATLERFRNQPEVMLLPLYTGDDGGSVFVSSDTWPGAAGVLGRTKAQIAEAKAEGVKPTRVGGFAYMGGPDNALVEYAGNHPAERFNHGKRIDNRKQYMLEPGDTIELRTPRGGGYGPPRERERALKQRDRALGYALSENRNG